MIVIENKDAEKIVESIVPDVVLSMNPILAGGFITSIFENCIQQNKAAKIFDIFHKSGSQAFDFTGSVMHQLKQHLKFGDIDVWFTKDNKFLKTAKYKSIISSDGFLGFDSVLSSNFYSGRESRWARTYNYSSNELYFQVQFIKKTFDDVESLLSNFDIVNCQAAYYAGKFYFSEEFIENMKNKTIVINDSFDDKSVMAKVWTLNRLFKYSERYNLEPSKELVDKIIDVFFDSEKIGQQIKNLPYTKLIKFEDVTAKELSEEILYGDGIFTQKSVSNILNMFFRNADRLFYFKNITDEQVLCFVGFKDRYVHDALSKYLTLKNSHNNGDAVNSFSTSFAQPMADPFF